MFFKAALFLFCASAASAAPPMKREIAGPFPTALIDVVTPSGTHSLSIDGSVFYEAPQDGPMMPIMPPPPSFFDITIIAGSPESGDVLVTLNGSGQCVLSGENKVLACNGGEDGESAATFRAKRRADGRWQLLGGQKSFTVNEAAEGQPAHRDISPFGTFKTEAQLYLKMF